MSFSWEHDLVDFGGSGEVFSEEGHGRSTVEQTMGDTKAHADAKGQPEEEYNANEEKRGDSEIG